MMRISTTGLFTILLLASSSLAAAAPGEQEDRTLSPYFFVQSDQSGDVDRLPLEETRADVDIAGVIARVKVTQVYKNQGGSPIEAVYVFPGSTRSAVFAMRMTIGERTIEAKIKQKDQARQIYETAKKQGKSASLLEQKRPNVFQMNVANIMPGDRVKVELEYVEALVPNDGIYEFVYPTVVGPRYSESTAAAQPSETWIENPHLQSGVAPPYRWDLTARINAGMGIKSVRSPSHTISPMFPDTKRSTITLHDPSGGNRDFVLRYRLSSNRVETGMLLFPGEKENFFLAMMQPPKRVHPTQLPAREYIFVIDVSGSMGGFPLETSKKLMRELLGGLRGGDKFNMLMFSGGSTVFSPESVEVTPANIERAIKVLGGQRGGGGTRILQALNKTLAMPRSEQMSTSVVVITDGYVSVERKAFDTIRDNLGTANLFAFGIGRSVNRFLIEGLARAGMGEPFVVLGPEQAEEKATKFRKYIDSPVLTRIRFDFDGFDAHDVVPRAVPDLFAQRPVVLFGKYKKAEGALRIEGYNGQGRFSRALNVTDYRPDEKNAALRYLWARHRIKELADYRRVSNGAEQQQDEKEVTRIGLKYNLMTEFTSFVAVDSVVRNTDGNSQTVRQALPMPDGVSNGAVGNVRRRTTRPMPSVRPSPAPSAPVHGFGGLGTRGTGAGGGGSGYGRGATAHGAVAPKVGRVSADKDVRVMGSLDRSQIQKTIRRAQVKLKRVYQSALQKDPSLKGKINVRLTIDAKGKVQKVTILKDTVNSDALRRAVLKLMSSLRFPAPSGGGSVVITYPLLFQP